MNILRLFRPGLLGVTVAPAVLAVAASPSWSASGIVLVVVFALSFHILGVLTNDLADRDVDSVTPRRSKSPLVTAAFSPSLYLWLSIAACCVIFGIAFIRPHHAAVILLAVVSMAVYNAFGKRLSVPFVMDLVQGLSWGWFFAAVHGLVSPGQRAADRSILDFGAIVLFFTIMNSLHGGVRDLAVDSSCGRKTTPLLLGVSEAAGLVSWSPPFVKLVFCLQFACCAVPVMASSGQSTFVLAYCLTFAVFSSVTLYILTSRPRLQQELLAPGSIHMVLLFTMVGAGVAGISVSFLCGLTFVIPMFIYEPFRKAMRWQNIHKVLVGKR